MKTTKSVSVLALIALSIVLPSCKSKKPQAQEWYRYVSAFTSGAVSRKAPIRVLFVDNVGTEGEDPSKLEGILKLNPEAAGKTEWQSPRELVFTPAEELQPGKEYKATVHTSRFMKLPREYSRFEFSFMVIQPSLEIDIEGLSPQDEQSPNQLVLRGVLNTSDQEAEAAVRKIITADQEGKFLSLEWVHDREGRGHRFLVKGIERREQSSTVKLTWNGASIRAKAEGARTIPIPSRGQFELLDAGAMMQPDRFVLLRFSDPLKKNQNLTGLITISGHTPTFEIDNNVIRIYSAKGFDGAVEVVVDAAVRNFNDRRFGSRVKKTVYFERVAPQVRFVGKGAILPQKDQLTVPFEAVNLRSVQVTAFQIYSNNMAQFFQQNNLEGKENLSLVGRFLWRKTVRLADSSGESAVWRRYAVDVTQLLKDNPGSLFRLTLSFNQGDSTYSCPDGESRIQKEPELQNQDDASYRDFSNWDWSEDNYSGEYWGSNWTNRSNPCHPAYYNPRFNAEVFQARNFIATNIGLLAKYEENGTLHIVATDIRTAEPLSGTKIRVFNFQNQFLGEGSSDGSGFVKLKTEGRPFYIEAQGGRDKNYLRLSREGALAMSHFDVGGENVAKGVRGTIYGERGVWRPGDTLYLTFVLFDRDRVLPKEHPLVMEIYNPRSQLVRTVKPLKSLDIFHAFQIDTDEADLTGTWKARVLVGGLVFDQPLKIETVVPNRLKIEFVPERPKLIKGVADQVTVRSQWLHGAPAANLRCDVRVKFNPRSTRFPKYADFSFDDPARSIASSEESVFDGNLDTAGETRFPVELDLEEEAPGMMDASFITRVFEASGDFSSDFLTLPFHPYESYVGIKPPKGDESRGMLLTDQDHSLQIVTVDPDGNPVSREGLQASLYKVDWKWWWDKSGDSLAQYASSSVHTPLQKGVVATRNGVGAWKFRVNYPDWGRYLLRVVDPQSGHATGRIIYIDWPGWAGRAREEKGAGATRLNFSSDKERYQVGEKAVVFLPAAVQGRALVSIETGSSVLEQRWVSCKEGENKFEVPIIEPMTPNIYIHVTLLQPHSGKKSDTPIRLYGVIPILVENPKTLLDPQLQVADELKPRQEFKVAVKEKNGRPMTYTLAVVDEGLLGLTRYSAPDLRQRFYNREAYGILNWDIFDDVAEAYGGELSRLLALGGDEEGGAGGKEKKEQRFPPVVMVAGPFTLDARKTAEHKFTMPQYIGAVRVMIVAGRDGAFGSAQKSVPVRQDLMVLPTLPRAIRAGETFDLPVAVFVSRDGIKNVQVAVEASDLFMLNGPGSKTVSFGRPGDQIVTFQFSAASALGRGSIRVQASSGSLKAESKTTLEIVAINPRLTQSTLIEVPPGQTQEIKVKPFGLLGTREIRVEVSAVPPFQLEKRLQYLIHFPHGCLEQTLSIAFPQIYLKSLMKLSPEQQNLVETHIKAAIEKLRGFQTPSGGFSYWPGGSTIHDWSSAYAGYFLVEASRLGYQVPPSMLDRWKKQQKVLSNSWTEGDMQDRLTQAFRLFCLALARDPDLGAMNRLREFGNLESPAAVLLAGAFQVSGQSDAAQDLLKKCKWTIGDYRDDSRTFGSVIRDKAVMVRILVHMNMIDRARKMAEELALSLGTDQWYSTQETAFSLMALASYYGGSPVKPIKFKLGWESQTMEALEATTAFYQKQITAPPAQEKALRLANPGETKLYMTVYQIGVPPAGTESASTSNLRLEVKYFDLEGQPIEVGKIKQGSDFKMEIAVTNLSRSELNNLALTHMVPAGCQIANPRLAEGETAPAPFDYQDVRDDRIYTYFSLKAGARSVFSVALNASYSGRFYLPGIKVESMYDPAVHANTVGKWVEIVR